MHKATLAALRTFAGERADDPANPRAEADRALVAVAKWIVAQGQEEDDWLWIEATLFGGYDLDEFETGDVVDLFDDPKKDALVIEVAILASLSRAHREHPDYDPAWDELLPKPVRAELG